MDVTKVTGLLSFVEGIVVGAVVIVGLGELWFLLLWVGILGSGMSLIKDGISVDG